MLDSAAINAPSSAFTIADAPQLAPVDGGARPAPRHEAPRHGLLTEERERALLRAYAERGDRDALAELLQSHLRLVLRIARRSRAGALALDDLVSEGMLGLLEAARRFDPIHGVRFATYAAHWVRAYVQRYALGHRRIVGMPDTRAARRIFGRIGRVEPKLSTSLGRAPSSEELASALGVEADELSQVRACLSGRDVALGVGADEGGTHWEPTEHTAGPEDALAEAEEKAMLVAALERALVALPPRERAIVERRCLAAEPPTLDVLAREMSLSRERVRQLEVRALSRLREALAQAA